jgi:AraC-like DNA-binding protein
MLADATARGLLFADLLRSIRVRSSVFARPQLRAPWGFRLVDEGAAFHIVTRGHCLLSCEGAPGTFELAEGDYVVLPRGGTHVVRDAPGTVAVALDDALKARLRGAAKPFGGRGSGESTVLICGSMRFEDPSTALLLELLPPVIHVKSKGSRLAAWLNATIEQLRGELAACGPAADVLIARIADMLVLQAVAMHFDDHADSAESGWLAALRDRQIGPALALLHRHPERTWTVESLAASRGLSRSAFAARFAQLVGEPPLRYLSRVRLSVAGARLTSGDETMSTIAMSLGYESVSGFNKAFKARFGIAPGEYRGRFSPRTGA